jgi:hypothetical protein
MWARAAPQDVLSIGIFTMNYRLDQPSLPLERASFDSPYEILSSVQPKAPSVDLAALFEQPPKNLAFRLYRGT